MKRFTVVTEGKHDVALLKALLNVTDDNPNVKFVAAGGWSSADSLARSFLIHGDTNVALVVDADTREPNQVEDRKRFLHMSLGEISSPAMWKVFVIDPDIERLLFEDRDVVEALVGRPISDIEFVSASFEPKTVLRKLLRGQSLTEVYDRTLRRLDLSRIRLDFGLFRPHSRPVAQVGAKQVEELGTTRAESASLHNSSPPTNESEPPPEHR